MGIDSRDFDILDIILSDGHSYQFDVISMPDDIWD